MKSVHSTTHQEMFDALRQDMLDQAAMLILQTTRATRVDGHLEAVSQTKILYMKSIGIMPSTSHD